MAAFTAALPAVAKPAVATRKASAPAAVCNASEAKVNAWNIWKSEGNKFFETFSYLPPLTDAEISKQVGYLLKNKWTPCIEFDFPETSYAEPFFSKGFDSSASAGAYMNRYWVMWKLPMFGATDPDMVLSEIKKATKAFPNAFIRIVGFDAILQVQVVSFLVHRPTGSQALAPGDRFVVSP